MISREVAEAIIKKIKDVTSIGGYEVKYIEASTVEKTIMDCQYAPPLVSDWQDEPWASTTAKLNVRLHKVEDQVNTLNDNDIKLRDGSSHDFNLVYERLDRESSWIEGLDKRLEDVIKRVESDQLFRSTEFKGIAKQFKDVKKDMERLTYYLNQLEKKMIEMKGAQLGRQAAEAAAGGMRAGDKAILDMISKPMWERE